MDRKHAKGVFAEQLMAQKYRLERYTEDELIKLYTALNLVQDKIVRGWGKTIKTEYSQMQALAMLEEARKIMADIKPKIESSIAGTLGKISEESASVYSDMITFGGAARAAQVALLSAQQMESFWRYTSVGGQLLNEWVTKAFDGPTVDRIQREIFAGMFQGEGYGEMVKRLQEGFVISKREADTLVRTYVHTANVHAMEEVYKKNRDVIAGVSWLTAFDKRTCMRCAALSGKLFPLDDHPPCPLHPRCRCVLVPETDIRKLKVKPKVADDWAKGLRDKRPPGLDTVLTPDGIPKTDFRRWILAQPEKDQLAFFGPTRYGLLKDGKIGWDDLFEEARFNGKENVRLRSLRELLVERQIASGNPHEVAAHIINKEFNRDALDWLRHDKMRKGLDERAFAKAMRDAARAAELFEAGNDVKARAIGGKALEKIVRGLELQGYGYKFKGVDMVTDVGGTEHPKWLGAADPAAKKSGKLYLRDQPVEFDALTDELDWRKARYRTSKTMFSAFKKIQEGAPLTFDEEYSFTILLHETGHMRMPTIGDYLEMMNEWKARRDTPALIKRLGGEPASTEAIKKRGYGYPAEVANFDILLEHLDVADDAELLGKVGDICVNNLQQSALPKKLADLLEGKSGKDARPLSVSLPETLDRVFKMDPKDFKKWLRQKKKGQS